MYREGRGSDMPAGQPACQRGYRMQINLTPDAIEHIQSRGGQAAVDLLSFSS